MGRKKGFSKIYGYGNFFFNFYNGNTKKTIIQYNNTKKGYFTKSRGGSEKSWGKAGAHTLIYGTDYFFQKGSYVHAYRT